MKEIINNSGNPVIVNFSATWCGPCKMFAPIFDATKQKLINEFTFVKCDIDECEQFAMDNNIQSVPTLIIFNDGIETKRRSGAFPTVESFEAWIKG
ncbi:MAG: thioredoxin family protein [Firmicutes bacterium]|nr:thioredoxin family protein [Bacillota bacterium]